jgi:hypothetical protein
MARISRQKAMAATPAAPEKPAQDLDTSLTRDDNLASAKA